jgi:hypothetical protein
MQMRPTGAVQPLEAARLCIAVWPVAAAQQRPERTNTDTDRQATDPPPRQSAYCCPGSTHAHVTQVTWHTRVCLGVSGNHAAEATEA